MSRITSKPAGPTVATSELADLVGANFILEARRSDAHTLIEALDIAAAAATEPYDATRFDQLSQAIRVALGLELD